MKNKEIYLDYAASVPLSDSMKKYIMEMLDIFGNPSSMHQKGNISKSVINDSRKIVADFLKTQPEYIYFTSGGSASNTLGIKGFYEKHQCTILYSPTLHKSALRCIKSCGKSVSLKVDKCGFIDIEEVRYQCMINPKSLVVIEYANSEIGTIQDVRKIIEIAHIFKCTVYVDCTGAISTIPIDVGSLDMDMCGFSGHKIGALKGCGVFYKKTDIEISPIVYGNQESGLIGGTENTLGIASLAKAIIDLSYCNKKNFNYIWEYIYDNISDSYLVGSSENRLNNNLYVCFKGVEAESLVMLMDLNGIYISTGSACNNKSLEPSDVLMAIGIEDEDLYSCVRLSLSGKETIEELDFICSKLNECVDQLRNCKYTEE